MGGCSLAFAPLECVSGDDKLKQAADFNTQRRFKVCTFVASTSFWPFMSFE
jgi:hypothetical protein